jgi:hypothetical protein
MALPSPGPLRATPIRALSPRERIAAMNRIGAPSSWRLAAALVTLISAGTLLVVSPAEGQTIRGTVLTPGDVPQPLEGAIVRLLTADSQHVDMVLSTGGGHFRLVAPRAGHYILQAEHVLHTPTQTLPFTVPATGTVVHHITITPRPNHPPP